MKNKILQTAFGCLLISLSAFTQEPILPKTDNESVTLPDVEAEFPGGIRAFIQYIDENLIHPLKVLRDNISGKTYIRFVIEKDGSVSNISVTRGVPNCPECDKEAGNVIKNSQKWNPAYKYEQTNALKILDDNTEVFTTPIDQDSTDIIKKPIRSYYHIPVSFKLMDNLLFPEGYNTFIAYISENIDYPKQALKEKIRAEVAVKIEFGESRTIERTSLIKGIENCNECNEAILHVLQTVPINVMTIKENVKTPFVFNTYVDFNAGVAE